MTSPKARLFGLEIDVLNFDDSVSCVWDWLKSRRPGHHVVMTPNVNHAVLFDENQDFQRAYQAADLVLADGRYIVLASRLLGRPLPGSVNGSDLIPAVFDRADLDDRLSVFLLGAKPGVGEKAAQNIEKRWPGVRITGIYSPPFGFEKSDIECKRMIDVVNAARPQLLVIGLSPPKQEIWIAQSIEQLDINVAVCAGATIDFLAGTVLRAPRWMQVAGMEWVFRILTEPTRLGPRYAVDGIKFLRILIREWRAASRN